MNDLLKYLFGGLLGFGVAKLISDSPSSAKKEKESKNNQFYVYVRSNDFGKSGLRFDERELAQKYYNKIVTAKKVRYKDIVDFDASERKLYNQWKKEGNIGKEGYPTLSKQSKVQEVIFGQGDEVFNEKEF